MASRKAQYEKETVCGHPPCARATRFRLKIPNISMLLLRLAISIRASSCSHARTCFRSRVLRSLSSDITLWPWLELEVAELRLGATARFRVFVLGGCLLGVSRLTATQRGVAVRATSVGLNGCSWSGRWRSYGDDTNRKSIGLSLGPADVCGRLHFFGFSVVCDLVYGRDDGSD